MDIRNETPFECEIALGMGRDRQAGLAVVVKGTFAIPNALDGEVVIAEEQQPVLFAPEHHNGDVTGSLRLDADTAPFKPRADLALVGTAYAPGGQAAGHFDVLLKVGRTSKALRIFGDRHWLFPTQAVMIPIISTPKPITALPLVYEHAFGGTNRKGDKWFDKNFGGKGFLGRKTKPAVDGKALPNIENPTRLIASWNDEPMPSGYGFYSRAWQPRAHYGGTEKGMANPHETFGLAADFDHTYYNGAHPDLQVPGYLRGDEPVDLINLTRDGRRRFQLPGVRPTITLRRFAEAEDASSQSEPDPRATETHALEAVLDTLVLFPDDGLFFQVWRGVYALPVLESGLEAIAEIAIEMGDV